MSAPKIPYPPSPTDVPEGFTDFAESHTRQQNRLLAGLFVFLIFYVAMVIFFAMVGTWCALTLAKWLPFKVVGIVLCSTFFLFLVKGFFKRDPMSKEMHVELTEEEQPVLFGFIHQLCEELGAPLPNAVFVAPDVNAMCISRISLMNLFVEPKRDLLIGLGLVNCVNLSEFKAIVAHEFGHFCHLGHTKSYAYVVQGIILDLVKGEDWFDRLIHWSKKQKNAISYFGNTVGACLWLGRKVLWWILKTITLQDRALSREREFHADKVAVSAAGSDASTHGLLRARFGMQCFIQAINDLVIPARDNKQYSNDLYLHQDRAAAIVRRKKKDAMMGLPPALPTPTSGKKIKVFDAEADEMEDNDETPPMWRTHPADADREENAKEDFIPAVMDHRSPWILFTDVAELKERLTYKFYRMQFGIPKDADLTDAQQLQEYVDNEHAETTYDPKYHGAYDDRPLEPGDPSELNAIVANSPWTEERMEKVFDKLYDGCKEHAEEHADLHKEHQSLQSNVVGKPSPKMKKMIADVEKKMETNWEWFKSFDRRVYLLHVQMAAAVDPDLKDELIERYRFQLEVQRFYQEARFNFNKADNYIDAYHAAAQGKIQVSRDFGAEVIAVLRAAWKALKKIIQDAREVNLPAMKNFEEGERLADFILEGKMVPEPPLSELKGVWVQKLMNQLQGVKNRCFRLHFKSVGGVLSMQEKIAAKWVAARSPVAAEAIADDVVATEEVFAAEVIPDDAIAAEVIPDDVVAAEVIPDDVIPADVIPAAPIEPPGHSLAAFVTASPPPPAPATQASPVSPPARATSRPVAPPPAAEVLEPLPLDPEEAIVEEPAPAKVLEPHPLDPEIIEEIVEEPAPVVAAPKPAVVVAPAPEPIAAAEVDNPFSFDPTPPAPAPTTAPATETKLPDSPVAEIFALDAATPAPTVATDYFSLDVDAEAPTEVTAKPAPAPKPNPKPAPPVEEVFNLDADADANTVPSVAPKSASAPEPIPVEEIFSLDADDAPAVVAKPTVPPKPAAKPKPAPVVEEIFDAEVIEEIEVIEVIEVIEEIPTAPVAVAAPVKPTAPLAAKPTSGTVPQPAAKPTGSGTVATPVAKPPLSTEASPAASGTTVATANGTPRSANGKRPAVKITFVRPGEKSPFAK